MRYGAMNFPVRPILPEIKRIAGLGFNFMELALDPPEAHYSVVDQQKNDIARMLKENGLGLVCHLPTFVYTADLTQSIRQASLMETLRSMETAAMLGAEKVVVHPGYIGGMAAFVIERARGYALESLAAISHRADELGICLCLENMFPRYLSFVEVNDFREILQTFERMHLTLDTGHANMDDPHGHRAADFLKAYGDKLGHVHISDNHGKRDEHLPVGEGNFRFKPFMSGIKKIGYDGTITLEIFTDNPQDLIRSREIIDEMI